MANTVVGSWTACIKELQQMIDRAGEADASAAAFNAFRQRLETINQQPPLPNAVWKKLVQDLKVTCKVSALFNEAFQQPDRLPAVSLLAADTMMLWLNKAVPSISASPGSRAAATVRQQLQESRLLQHLAPNMDAAAARLTAAAAALAAAGAASNSNTAAGAVLQHGTVVIQCSADYVNAESLCKGLLIIFQLASCVLSPLGTFTIPAALPAAPAAVRMSLNVFQVYRSPLPVDLAQRAALRAVMALIAAFQGQEDVPGSMLQSCPAASVLVQMPEFVACLVIMAVATTLGLDVSGGDAARGAATPAASSSSTGGSSTGPGRQQQPAQQAGSGNRTTGSGSSDGAGSRGSGGTDSSSRRSSSGLSNGVRLDSLTPLSCSLFDILGVTRETALQLAGLAKIEGFTTLAAVHKLLEIYSSVLEYQVEQAQGAFSAQLLLQLETDMLLTLMVRQLTASIPDSPEAQAARDLAYKLSAMPLYDSWRATSLHQLPRPAGYTGPQVALQLLPSPLQPQSLQQLEREQQQQQQEQPVEWCAVAPSAPFLSELLPLLTHHCLAQLQLHHKEKQQQQQRGASHDWEPPAPLEVLWGDTLCIQTLLLCSVVPAPPATSEGSLPAAAKAVTAVATAVGHDTSQVPYSCVLHAQDAFMAHAGDITSIFEAALRWAATPCNAAAAAAPPDGAGGAAGTTLVTAAAACELGDYAPLWAELCYPKVPGDNPPYPSPLVLLALAAGPGSQVQRQLHSLLATMVKLSGWGILGDGQRAWYHAAAACAAWALLDGSIAQPEQQQVQQEPADGAGAERATGCSSGHAAAVAMLPSVVILGRCCMQWGEQQQWQQQHEEEEGEEEEEEGEAEGTQEEGEEGGEEEGEEEAEAADYLKELPKLDYGVLLSKMHWWMAAGSTTDQLGAAGYAVLLLQQQLLATGDALKENPPDTAAMKIAAQQLQSTGLALCSFAVPCMCNNPGCTSMAGLSELASVSGRSCICAGCRVARYCGRACQRAAWKQHKPVCGALSAAAGGDAGVARPDGGQVNC